MESTHCVPNVGEGTLVVTYHQKDTEPNLTDQVERTLKELGVDPSQVESVQQIQDETIVTVRNVTGPLSSAPIVIDTSSDYWQHQAGPVKGERKPKLRPIIGEKPPARRNEKCPCGSGTKYKRCCGRLPWRVPTR